MPGPVLTIRTDHPRIYCNSTEKTAIANLSNDPAGWKSTWDNKIISYCNANVGISDATMAIQNQLDLRLFCFGIAGWIDNVSSYHTKLKGACLHLLNNSSLWFSYTAKREQVMAMAFGYTFVSTGVISFSDSDRKTWGEKLLQMCDASIAANSTIDGHEAGNTAAELFAALALYGETGSSPSFNHTAGAQAIIDKVFSHWYGSNPGDASKLDSDRYYRSDGAAGVGPGYSTLRDGFLNRLIIALKKSCTSLTMNGDPYDPVVDETFFPKMGEWFLRMYERGDGDYMTQDDTPHVYPDPFFDPLARITIGSLIKYSNANLRGPLRRLRDRRDAKSGTNPYSATTHHYGVEIPLWDPTDPANASKTLTQAGHSKGRLFEVPGEFIYDSNPDDPVNGVKIHIQCREFMYHGHTHLAQGGMQVSAYGDQLIQFTGLYHTTPSGNKTDFGGIHHRGWNQQSIAASGVPLIDKPGLTHKARNLSGSLVDWPSGQGGQLWKEYVDSGIRKYDADSISQMRFDGGKMAWRRAGIDANGTNRFRMVDPAPGAPPNGRYLFMHADYTHAYHKEYLDAGTPNARVTLVETKWLIMEDLGTDPVILRVDRIIATSPSYTKRQHWHGHGPFSLQTITDPTGKVTLRTFWQGFNRTGKVFIDVLGSSSLGSVSGIVLGGAAPDNLNSLAANMFSYGGTDYTPDLLPNGRDKPDFGRYRVEHTFGSGAADSTIATLIFAGRSDAQMIPYEWIDEPNWVGIKAFPNKEYRVHKTLTQILVSADTTPPAIPSGLAGVAGPNNAEVTLSCTPNGDLTEQYVYEKRSLS